MQSVQRKVSVLNTKSQPLRINGVVAESCVDGPGLRYVIFVQGCPHHCEGCHNPQTHDFHGGNEVSTDKILAEIKSDPLLSGVTFSGGEPFCQAGVLAELAQEIHALGMDVMVYSGWTLEQLKEKAKKEEGVKALLDQTDILVDGPFILAERDLELDFRGSRNQRVIYLT